MRYVLLGAPGAGKGTQAKMLTEKFNIPHISTGDIFRDNIKRGTDIGMRAKNLIDQGILVPDEITMQIVKGAISDTDCQKGFVLDGFPRTILQAEYLDDIMKELGIKLDGAIYIYVSDDTIIKRMSGRRVCPDCGRTYHIISLPMKSEGVCDDCESAVVQRNDDKEEVVISRLRAYHGQIDMILEYYKKSGRLITVEGQESVEDTINEMLSALGVN